MPPTLDEVRTALVTAKQCADAYERAELAARAAEDEANRAKEIADTKRGLAVEAFRLYRESASGINELIDSESVEADEEEDPDYEYYYEYEDGE